MPMMCTICGNPFTGHGPCPHCLTPPEGEGIPEMSYLFSMGNSTKGTIGFCVRVKATSKEQALATIKESLHDYAQDQMIADIQISGLEYCTIYVNPDAITLDDIEEVN